MTKFIARAIALLTCVTMMVASVSSVTAAARTPIVTEAQNGKTVVVAIGAPLVIALESNPSTGYSWRVSKNDAAVVKFLDQSAFPPARPVPGTLGRELFKFKAIAPGTDSIELEYLRPWEKGVAPAKRFSISVTVK